MHVEKGIATLVFLLNIYYLNSVITKQKENFIVNLLRLICTFTLVDAAVSNSKLFI